MIRKFQIDLLPDLFDRAVSIDMDQPPLCAVKLYHRQHIFLEKLHTVMDRQRMIIITRPLKKPGGSLLFRYINIDAKREVPAVPFHHVIQKFGFFHFARRAIKHAPSTRARSLSIASPSLASHTTTLQPHSPC